MRYVFIVNPIAGKGKYEQTVLPKIEECFAQNSLEYSVHITKQAGESTQFVKNECLKGDDVTFFACGGEGTGLEVLNGMVGFSNATFAIFPSGSANDFLKYFNDKAAFLDLQNQIDGTAIPVDLIKAGDMYAINQCSVGMDANVANDMKIFKKWPLVSGPLAYNLSVVKTFFGKIGNRIQIKIDGEDFGEKDCLFAVCANGPVYGGGYNSAPSAVPFDEKLEYVIINKISRPKILKFLGTYKAGKHQNLPFCKVGSCKSMEIISKKPIPINLDGEITLGTYAKFELVAKKVNFLLPKTVAEKYMEKELLKI
ncbi:MAG: YegS/Rv2252/BmrU family lipid kinase [Clostridia bacterium]|nr:YegS/Rv2252/BmrU family lipid kinase [Clostridia bacterium]